MNLLSRLLASRWLLALVGACCLVAAIPGRAADDFLAPEVAFKPGARAVDAKTLEVSFEIAPGYYLYREQFRFEANGATLAAAGFPAGHVKFDETFQKNVETYRETLRIPLPVTQAPREFELTVRYQGCADKGLCYPPQQMVVKASLAGFGGSGKVEGGPARDAPPPAMSAAASQPGGVLGAITGTDSPAGAAPAYEPRFDPAASPAPAEPDRLDAALRDGHFWSIVAVFFAAGLLLSLTPCVLPMLPILSSIIVGQGEAAVPRGRAVGLAASYSLGMALVYTALGIAAGLAGEGLAATLQKPAVLGLFALMLVALSLSMFGVYELQLPQRWTGRMTAASQRLPAGRIAGVFAMGGVSALIVSPCVAAPLAGALVYISQTRDVALGGTALFALAAGMSVPLMLLGASAGALLPRAGAWMDEVKRVFGVLLLGVAIWTVQSVLPGPLVLAAWGALLIGTAVMLYQGRPADTPPSRRLARTAAATLAGVFGLLQWVGAASGGSDPLQPLIQLKSTAPDGTRQARGATPFMRVRSVAELEAALADAKRPVMLDFYADWCVSCKEMERFTFSDPAVAAKLGNALLLQVDVTANNDDDRALLKRFSLFGPPGTIFFDGQGREVAQARVVGYQNTSRFLQTLATVGL